jgi:hypothetical protein
MLTDEQGVQAIIDLQKVVGIDEPEERARRSWENFAEWEKKSTERAHKAVCGGFKE